MIHDVLKTALIRKKRCLSCIVESFILALGNNVLYRIDSSNMQVQVSVFKSTVIKGNVVYIIVYSSYFSQVMWYTLWYNYVVQRDVIDMLSSLSCREL